jgi:hypothetical protein
VQVDVELTSTLPDEARPDLSIDGEIFITQKKNSLYVRRPAFSQANQTMAVYLLNAEQTQAQQIPVEFGLSSSVDIEIVNGLKAGDKIIVSEQTSFERHQQVALK